MDHCSCKTVVVRLAVHASDCWFVLHVSIRSPRFAVAMNRLNSAVANFAAMAIEMNM